MASTETVWGIDIGQCALKALKLSSNQGEIRLEAFELIEHPGILNQVEADRDQLVRNALEQFLQRNDVTGSTVVVSAPGQSGFTRFVKLPPVEEKQVPEIVRFEAEQQIPFNIDEVIWRWQSFRDPDSPDREVGIFAMKRSDVWDVIGRFADMEVTVDVVQMAPLALYNFLDFDGQVAENGATLLMDVGTDKTDLVVSDGVRIWTRTLQLGGNNFTEALVKAFKLNFNKAEKLKRTAATSKYARQIFQAMRPVFAELVQEVQRSIGYYTSLHRESRFRSVLGLGNGFRLPGLQKYLEQNLGIPVVRVDGFERLSPTPTVNAPAFTENILSFGVAYGLALQGLGVTRIHTNLLPSENVRRRRWASKRPAFAAAAVIFLVVAAIGYGRARYDRKMLEPENMPGMRAAREKMAKYDRIRNDFNKVRGRHKDKEKLIGQNEQMMAYRDFWPTVQYIISESIRQVATDQEKMNEKNIEQLKKEQRSDRNVIIIDSLQPHYKPDISGIKDEDVRTSYSGALKSTAGGAGSVVRRGGPVRRSEGRGEHGRDFPMSERREFQHPGLGPGAEAQTQAPTQAHRGFVLYLEGSTPRRGREARLFISDFKDKFSELAAAYFPSLEVTAKAVVSVVEGSGSAPLPGRGGERREIHERREIRSGREGGDMSRVPKGAGNDPGSIDPLTGEPDGADTRFVVGWSIKIVGDGLPEKPKKQAPAGTGGER